MRTTSRFVFALSLASCGGGGTGGEEAVPSGRDATGAPDATEAADAAGGVPGHTDAQPPDATGPFDAAPSPDRPAPDARGGADAAETPTSPPPVVTIDAPMEGETTRGPEIRVAGHTTGGERPLRLSVDGTPFDIESGPFAVTVAHPRPEAVTLRVVVTDALGRRDEARVRVVHNPLTLDVTPPEIRIDSPVEGARVAADFSIVGRANDPVLAGAETTGVAELTLDDLPVAPPLSPFRVERSGGGVAGQSLPATLEFMARDAAGNEARLVRGVVVDREPPTVRLLAPADVVYSEALSVRVEADDAAGIDAVWLEGPGGVRTPLEARPDGQYGLELADWPTGPQLLTLSAADTLGNAGVSVFPVQREAPVPDTTAPVLEISAPAAFAEVDAPLLIEGSILDLPGHPGEQPSGATRVTADGQSVEPGPDGTFALGWNGLPGPRVIEVQGEDAVGNIALIQVAVHVGEVGVDAEPPAIAVDSPEADGEAFAEHVRLTGGVTDLGAGPRSVRVGELTVPVVEGRFALTLPGLPGGENTVEVVADDWAGNETRLEHRFLRRPAVEGGAITFVDVTGAAFAPEELPAAGGDTAGAGIGAAVRDFDGDGDPDVVTAGTHNGLYPAQTGAAYYENTTSPGGAITLARRPAAFDPPIDALEVYALAHGDADGDGNADVYVGCDGQDRLYLGDGAGHFADATQESGLPVWGGRTAQAVFVDFDFDGWDDLYISGFPTEDAARRSYAGDLPFPPRTRLLMNRGGGRFEDVAPAAGLIGELVSTHASLIFDLDADGDLDIYDANDVFTQGGPDQVWVQLPDDGGDPRFEAGRDTWGLDDETYRMGAALADIDVDGQPELYLTDVDPKRLYDLWEGLPLVDRAPALGIQQPRRADPARPGRTEALWGWGADFTDFDRDGFPDLFLVNGSVASAYSRTIFFQNPYVFHSRLGRAFDDVTEATGLHEIAPFNPDLATGMWFRGVSAGDFDADGDRDLFLSSMLGPFRLLRNDSRTIGHVLRLELRATVTGPSAVGAIVSATADAWTHTGFLSAGGQTRSSPEPVLEIPLGAVSRLESVSIRWPGGLQQRLDPLPAWDLHTVVEEPRWLVLDPPEAAPGAAVAFTLTWPEPVARVVVTLDGVAAVAVQGPDGVYRATLTAPERPGRFRVATTLDGRTLPARPHLTVR
jgi:hypothetical protein